MRPTDRYAAQNRRARHDYLIEDTLEAGLVLHGTEVKVLRQGGASIAELMPTRPAANSICQRQHPGIQGSAHFNHQPRRRRKLLLHRKQMNRLLGAIRREGVTIVPLSIYFNERGRAKVELGLATGKRKVDKRHAERDRDWQRSRARLMRSRDCRMVEPGEGRAKPIALDRLRWVSLRSTILRLCRFQPLGEAGDHRLEHRRCEPAGIGVEPRAMIAVGSTVPSGSSCTAPCAKG